MSGQEAVAPAASHITLQDTVLAGMDVQMPQTHALLLAILLYLCCQPQVCCQQCNGTCQCPLSEPICSKDVPLVLDGCGCCRVCARQKGESCSEVLICDKKHGLQCDYSASFPGEPGECVREEELGCELNGISYQDGEVFQPSCATRCRCVAGGVTCIPLCKDDIRLPTSDCPHPQRVQLPGKCCKEWVCDHMDNSLFQDPQTANRPDQSLPAMPGFQASPSSNCIEQSTEWSACSHTCGPGISTRVTNQNPACKLEKQIRLCKVRPCYTFPVRSPVWPRKCQSSYRSAVPMRLVHQGCYSTRLYRPRYCGYCTDGRCCTPYSTHTIIVPFHCRGGHLVHQAIMMISSCICHYNCPYSPGATYSRPAFWH